MSDEEDGGIWWEKFFDFLESRFEARKDVFWSLHGWNLRIIIPNDVVIFIQKLGEIGFAFFGCGAVQNSETAFAKFWEGMGKWEIQDFANDFCSLNGASERTGNDGVNFLTSKLVGGFASLRLTQGSEGRVKIALFFANLVPFCFTMSDENEFHDFFLKWSLVRRFCQMRGDVGRWSLTKNKWKNEIKMTEVCDGNFRLDFDGGAWGGFCDLCLHFLEIDPDWIVGFFWVFHSFDFHSGGGRGKF